MTDISSIVKRYGKSVRTWHSASGRFVADVLDHKVKASLSDELTKFDPELRIHINVAPATVYANQVELSTDGRIKIVYFGELPTAMMRPTGFGKRQNAQFEDRFVKFFEKVGFYAPVILTPDGEIIDGEVRLRIAQAAGKDRLPALVVNATPTQAKLLRLALNKSREFQRWRWDEIDEFLDAHPELIQYFEPLGMFGERVVPESFLGDTVTGYEIHAETLGKTQQSFYKQEHGLARWAEEKRARIAAATPETRAEKKAKEFAKTASLFDLLDGAGK